MRGVQARIGLEDTLQPARRLDRPGHAALVSAAVQLFSR